MRINPTGSIAIDGATKYGTSGQVLTSAGDAPPTWETFNGVTGSGTTNTVPRWSSSSSLGDGPITFFQNAIATWESANANFGGRIVVGGLTDNTVDASIHIGRTNSNNETYILMRTGTGSTDYQNWALGIDASDGRKFKIGDGVNPSGGNTYLAISPSGSVGIGTEAPVGSFIVKDGSVNALFVTNTSCGNVGIKTTNPNASLVVKGNISYTYTNYTNVQNTFVNVISMAGYPSGLYQISIMKQTNASSYITAIIKWDSTAVGSSAGSIVNTIASNQVGIGFNGSTTLQAISGLTTGTAMSANLKCLVKYEAACV